jgi:hypothetical protein
MVRTIMATGSAEYERGPSGLLSGAGGLVWEGSVDCETPDLE